MHFPAAKHAEGIRRLGLLHAEGHILLELAEQAVAQVAGSDEVAFPPRKRAVVDREGHFHRRL